MFLQTKDWPEFTESYVVMSNWTAYSEDEEYSYMIAFLENGEKIILIDRHFEDGYCSIIYKDQEYGVETYGESDLQILEDFAGFTLQNREPEDCIIFLIEKTPDVVVITDGSDIPF